MKCKIFLALGLACLPSYAIAHDENAVFVEQEAADQQWPGRKIALIIDDDHVVGFVNYAKISPQFGWYALYELYVYPQYRGKGYAKQLLTFACDLLSEKGANRIFIQPGPFELETELEEADYEQRVQQLIHLYEDVGFVRASAVLRILAIPCYKLAGIPENPRYLMVRVRS